MAPDHSIDRIERALHRLLAADPPPLDDLAGLVARARVQPLAQR